MVPITPTTPATPDNQAQSLPTTASTSARTPATPVAAAQPIVRAFVTRCAASTRAIPAAIVAGSLPST